jgi:Helix-turn-helix.
MLTIMKVTAASFDGVDSRGMAHLIETVAAVIEDMERRGITRYQLAKQTGISQATLSRIMSRQLAGVSAATIEKLVGALGLEVKITKPRKPRTKR